MYLFSHIINWIFPPACVECQCEGDWLCPDARQQLRGLTPQCHDLVPGVPVYVLGSYDHTVLGKLIRGIKFHGWWAASAILPLLVQPIVAALPKLPSSTVIVPVPLHRRRLMERGFNQSQLIAEAVSKVTGWKIQSLAKRHRYTHSQVGLTAELRSKNLKDAFTSRQWIASIPKCVILVDDVITTGATMRECAEVLRRAGVKKIVGVALAKG